MCFETKLKNVRVPPLSKRAFVPLDAPHELALVMIEPRLHHLLESVVFTMAHLYGGGNTSSLSIYHGASKAEALRIMFGSWPNVRLIPLPVDKLNSQTYSDYVTTVDFWLPFRNASFVLMFQTDSALFERVPPTSLSTITSARLGTSHTVIAETGDCARGWGMAGCPSGGSLPCLR